MRAIVATAIGGPEVLQMQEWPDPQPAAGQVLIRVAYAGVNFAEVMQR
jgi:NADPH:quinone reductase